MKVLETKKHNKSVFVAKDRLKSLLVSDRVKCTPDTLEKIHSDLFKTISKYIEIAPDEFEVKMTCSYIHIKFTGEE